MRILLTLALTLVLVSIATVAAAVNAQEKLYSGFIPTGTDVAAPPADAPKIDPSKVKFLLRNSCGAGPLAWPGVNGIVAAEIDLSDDLKARQLVQMGIAYRLEKCSSQPWGFMVSLRPGDPATFTDAGKGFEFVGQSLLDYPSDVVTGDWTKDKPGWIGDYRNFPRALKNQQAYLAEEERKRNAVLEQQRQAEQKIAARWAAFLKTNRVKHVVTIDQLTANPFVYQGQVVAIRGTFEKMNSATQGIFSARGHRFVVSGISTSRFTRSGSMVVLAGRVLGNIEVKPGPTLVPHLSFVGVWAD
jgi:hypothetical protein